MLPGPCCEIKTHLACPEYLYDDVVKRMNEILHRTEYQSRLGGPMYLLSAAGIARLISHHRTKILIIEGGRLDQVPV